MVRNGFWKETDLSWALSVASTDSTNLVCQPLCARPGSKGWEPRERPQPHLQSPLTSLGDPPNAVKQELERQSLEGTPEPKTESAEHGGDMRGGLPGCWGMPGKASQRSKPYSTCAFARLGDKPSREGVGNPHGVRDLACPGSIFFTRGSHSWDTGWEREEEAGGGRGQSTGRVYRAQELELQPEGGAASKWGDSR